MKKNLLLLLFALMAQMMAAITMQTLSPSFSLGTDSNYYVVEFTLPMYTLETIKTDCGTFTSISVPTDKTCDMTDNAGLPMLPIYNIELLLPYDASNLNMTILNCDTDTISISYPMEPSPLYSNKDCYDSRYYEPGFGWNNLNSWDNYLSHNYDTATAIAFTKHITYNTVAQIDSICLNLSVRPFLYSVLDSELEVITHVTFRINFNSQYSISRILQKPNAKPDFFQFIANPNPNKFEPYEPYVPQSKDKFLIVAPNRVATNSAANSALTTFENYKQTWYNVIRRTYSAGSTAADITSIIDSVRPQYILLIGSFADIPAASTDDGIYSDIEYSHHDEAIGRWIISADDKTFTQELQNIISKTMTSELHYSYHGVAALFSGDATLALRNAYKKVVDYADDAFNGTTFSTIKTYGSTIGTNQNTMLNILSNSEPQIFMYRGDAQYDKIGAPYNLQSTSISSINNSQDSIFPLGFGFAKELNDYTRFNFWGEKWLTEACGGVSLYGSTSETHLTPDQNLSKRIFDCLSEGVTQQNTISMGRLVYDVAKKYYEACHSGTREKQRRKYIYLGDPTISVFGRSSGNNNHAPLLVSPRDAESVETVTAEVVCYTAYNSMGQLLTSFAAMDELQNFLQSYTGLLIVQVTYSDNTTSVLKFIK